MKTCPCCKTEKPETEYNKHARSSDGLQVYCRPCSREKGRASEARRKAGIAVPRRIEARPLRLGDAEGPRDLVPELQPVRDAVAAAGPGVAVGLGDPGEDVGGEQPADDLDRREGELLLAAARPRTGNPGHGAQSRGRRT